ncbi:centromere protein X isoform X1 [Corvus cornix cornix]|uniref:centromere protein X isoform X1 n=1 Tax=Corvus cornix cornix TaxID=932674 RepID=UPI00194FAF4B|nr:centromere protein X isoform X1 [Corvus cornix cornix]XP_041881647.1 centromere protein X isoform X1 [Corvus kubaryi]XP_048179717.1 centromere protein X isoform X1 [Corvus hawaiiensis]
MEERDGRTGGFRKDTVDRLLRLHFRDGRTRVNADAQLLVAELLKVFVRGQRAGPIPRPSLRAIGSRLLPEHLANLRLIPSCFSSAASCTAGVLTQLPGLFRGAGPPPSSQDTSPAPRTRRPR